MIHGESGITTARNSAILVRLMTASSVTTKIARMSAARVSAKSTPSKHVTVPATPILGSSPLVCRASIAAAAIPRLRQRPSR
jgi:hypothetical protein